MSPWLLEAIYFIINCMGVIIVMWQDIKTCTIMYVVKMQAVINYTKGQNHNDKNQHNVEIDAIHVTTITYRGWIVHYLYLKRFYDTKFFLNICVP